MFLKELFLFISVIIFSSVSAFSQISGAAVSGNVADQNGAAVSGATVKIVSDSGEKKTTTTDENGKFLFSNLSGGNYRLTVEKIGFETISQTVAGGRLDLNLTLRVAEIGATVEVSNENYTVEDATTAIN